MTVQILIYDVQSILQYKGLVMPLQYMTLAYLQYVLYRYDTVNTNGESNYFVLSAIVVTCINNTDLLNCEKLLKKVEMIMSRQCFGSEKESQRVVRKLGSLLFLLEANIYSISAHSYSHSTAEISENSLTSSRLI